MALVSGRTAPLSGRTSHGSRRRGDKTSVGALRAAGAAADSGEMQDHVAGNGSPSPRVQRGVRAEVGAGAGGVCVDAAERRGDEHGYEIAHEEVGARALTARAGEPAESEPAEGG